MVQFSVVLKHLKRHRPDWVVDVKCGRGKHSALVGLCNKVWHDQEPDPTGYYDSVADLGWYENYCRYHDRPSSKITNCLSEVFGLGWDADLGRYEVCCPPGAMHEAAKYLRTTGATEVRPGIFNTVLVHYEGNTSNYKKNLYHWQARGMCDLIQKAGRIPIILDWDDRSPIPDQKTVFCPKADHPIWGGFGSGDASVIAALIKQSEAYVGIDSGPGKVASATDTPTLICWIKHHPIQFHDPAANTVHLIPQNHLELPPVCDEGGAGAGLFFRQHYLYRCYGGEHDLVYQAQKWLSEVLERPGLEDTMQGQVFVLPNGIGDAVWALLKIRHIAGNRPIDVISSGNPRSEVGQRSLPFLKRFDFIREVAVSDVPIHPDRDHPTNSQGRYVYEADGLKGNFHFLVPNATLEAGRRIEEWYPEFPTDWDVMEHFSWEGTERGLQLAQGLKPFAALYLGPEKGHTDEGHNRGWLWEPKHWIELGKALDRRGLNIAVVGANYDRSFWENYVKDGVEQAGMHWFDLLGKLEIGETFRFLREARCFISYQCGLGIVAHYLGVPTVMWWRPDQNSCHPERHVCFSNGMKDSWSNPALKDRYLGCLYARESVEDIVRWLDEGRFLV